MAAQLIFITAAELEQRISPKQLRRVFDDNRDGNADSDAVTRLRRDASSKVASYLAPLGLDDRIASVFSPSTGEIVDPVTAPIDPEVRRLTLDVAVALVAQRAPTIMQMDWTLLMKQAESDLKNLRDGKTTLLHAAAPHAANHGVFISSGNAATAAAPTQRFWDNTGDF